MKRLLRHVLIAACVWAQCQGIAQITNIYHFEREFEPVTIPAGSMTIREVVNNTMLLTGIVEAEDIFVYTNQTFSREYEGMSWGHEDPKAAWTSALAVAKWPFRVNDSIANNAGWVKGSKEAHGLWGAYVWYRQNTIRFQSSTSVQYVSDFAATSVIASVKVNSIGDFCPNASVTDIGPTLNAGYLGVGASEDYIAAPDLTAFYKLVSSGFLRVNNNDSDDDTIPDFADGYDLLPSTPDDDLSTGDYFLPWTLTIAGNVDVDEAVIRFVYPESDPHGVILTTNGYVIGDTYFGFFSLGPRVRLWKKQGFESRDGSSVENGGDYIPADHILAQHLGFSSTERTTDIYIEAVQYGSADIEIYIDPDGDGPKSFSCLDKIRLNVVRPRLVPDWTRDRKIDSEDYNKVSLVKPFRFWINDDDDFGDISEGDSDVPGQGGFLNPDFANHEDGKVNGRSDLLDFFPVWLDLYSTLSLYPIDQGYEYVLRQKDCAVRFVYSDLTRDQAGAFLTSETNTYDTSFTKPAHESSTIKVTDGGVTLSDEFLNKIVENQDKGVLMFEGIEETTAPLVLEIRHNDKPQFQEEMALRIFGVEDMYRHINLRPDKNGRATEIGQPPNYPDSLSLNDKNVFFLHGFNVNSKAARGWNAEMFKRIYWAGSQAMFWGVTWEGDLGLVNALHYQKDVANCFLVALDLYDEIKSVPNKTIMAHSLGNMVVSAAIEDYGLIVDNYFMLNAAVAIEAYDQSEFNTSTVSNHMVHEGWVEYNTNTWSATWHQLFASPDNRASLTWKSRFATVLNVAYNFYSTGDEIFELADETPGAFSGGLFHLERYAWHKQEIFKGRFGLGSTDEAGWGFSGEYTQAEANTATPENLRTNAVFRHDPEQMFASNIVRQTQNEILGLGIPALSGALGRNEMNLLGWLKDYDMEANKPSDYPSRGLPYNTSWLHSDLKDVAFTYTHQLFDELVGQGRLQ